jgi:HD-GYP domain-containing protein (c-di-GMP phosphodiesterase class II)/DNA-binding CsgD family transcriptional regulator
MRAGDTQHSGVRRGEVIAALSLATDLTMGQPAEFALKSCVLATRLAAMLGLGAQERGEIFYQALLRYIGCNAETHAMAALLGDEIDFRRDFALIDNGRAAEVAGLVFTYLRRAHADAGMLGMVAGVARGMLAAPKASTDNIAGHCEVAERLAERLGLSAGVRRNLGQIYERFDGRGLPRGLKGEAIAPAVAVVSFAQDAIVLRAAHGVEAAHAMLQARAGSAYDPRLVDRFLKRADELTDGLEDVSWDAVLALEPEPHALMSEQEFDEACLAMADFADLKSPYSVGHSRAVAALAAQAARHCGLPEADASDLSRAGLLHDIGQVAVPARIWLKPAALSDSEWEQVRLHTYYGERVLARPAALARLGAIVAQHHERLDGSGYHRGARGPGLTAQGKILAAAEAYRNKIEARPHRAALSAQAAADALRREAREGRLDGDAVVAVLAAAGHAVAPRKDMVGGLTEREIDVLRAIARGQSTKEIARILGISPKTVDNHTQSIFAKIGVKTRGGATLFAIEHGLCG